MPELTTDDLFGKVVLSCSDLRPIQGYFNCLNLIKPLLDSPDFKSLTTGFYINVKGRRNLVRLSYFTPNKIETEEVIRDFLNRNNNITLVHCEEPREKKISRNYGGEELRFRKFLHIYTQIGLDLLDYNRLYSQRLVAKYRLTYSTQKICPKPLFKPAFSKHSKFFNNLDDSSIEQLWEDLDYWHNIRINGVDTDFIADWAHFLVNMLLPGDWITLPTVGCFFIDPNPKPPITGELRTRMLRMFYLDMPENWVPNN